MARILLADNGIEFDGHTSEKAPLGGVESSVINLCNEFARRGHWVQVRNNCKHPIDYLGVEWRHFDDNNWPENIELYIANRGDALINRLPSADKTVFWIHIVGQCLHRKSLSFRYLVSFMTVRQNS